MCAYEVQYKQAGDSVNYAFKEEGKTLYIFFEGSNSITDWVRNFWFFKKPYKDMSIPYKVHSGFLAAWKTVEDIIIKKIKELVRVDGIFEYKFNQIITVGYSHGGALSGFCHECVWYNRPDIRDNCWGYGFESPRFYHGFRVKEQLKERWKNYKVIRNYTDIVTFAPPAIFCFTHVGHMIKIKPVNKKHYKFPKCISSHFPENVYASLLLNEVDI